MNDITEQLARATLSGPQRRFLEIVQRKSFGMAFIQRNQGLPHPGTSCHYDRGKWAEQYDWDSSQMKRVRDQLIQLGVLWFIPATPGRYQKEGEIGFVLNFTQWLPLQDVYRAAQRQKHCRRGAGYPKGRGRQNADAGISITADHPIFCADEDGPPDLSTTDHRICPAATARIPGSVANGHEPPPEADLTPSLGILTLEDALREETSACAAGALCATTANPPPPISLDEKKGRGRREQTAKGYLTSHPHVARAPRSPLPERRPNEQLHAYWLRALAEAQGQAKQEQLVVQACAQTMFSWPLTTAGTLNATDCQLIGRLRHAAGSWGTVLRWIFACDHEARCDVRGYLQGCTRHRQDAAAPRGRQGQAKRGEHQRVDLLSTPVHAEPEPASQEEPNALPTSVITPTERLAQQLMRQVCAPGTQAGREFIVQLGLSQIADRRAFFSALAELLYAKGITGWQAQNLAREACATAIVARQPLQTSQTTHTVALQCLSARLASYPAVVVALADERVCLPDACVSATMQP